MGYIGPILKDSKTYANIKEEGSIHGTWLNI